MVTRGLNEMSNFAKVKELTGLNIEDRLLISVVFEMSRFSDKQFVSAVRKIQKTHNVVIDTATRKILRKKYYYGDLYSLEVPYKIEYCDYNQENIEIAFEDCLHRLNEYDKSKIIRSMQKKVDDLKNSVKTDTHMTSWLQQYNFRRQNKLYSFVAFQLDQETFQQSDYNENIINDFIYHTYDSLENYRYLAIIVHNEIYDKKKECITWKLLYKAGIYAENFIQYREKFSPFHKEEQIEKLTKFMEERHVSNAYPIAKKFYSSISTGYKYEDCYISDNQEYKILIYKKIELDNTNIPCPSCNTTIQSGNSYPEIFLKSWECKNPTCPDRSKSGRGKRFDEYGTYRYFKLVENDENNCISNELYQSFRRDIFNHDKDWKEFLIKEYTYADEKIFLMNCNVENDYNRNLVYYDINKLKLPISAVKNYECLPIFELYCDALKNMSFETGSKFIKNPIEVVNGDSSYYLQNLAPKQIGTAITSPPYYNAREYSQWENLLMYFLDMLINCKAVYNSLAADSYYLYNIGDIVCEDNVYVVSNMSKHRVQLGFISSMVFEIAGYNLTGNIIWDKGEVQSKRNSTVNLFSGYVKCINCYEHILVFKKGNFDKLSNFVEKITPVIKINNKGENTYKHTAPYPLELVALIKPYLNEKLYLLDPFLGSGTTLKWCKKNGFNGIGIELNQTYYELCKENIYGFNEQLSLFG